MAQDFGGDQKGRPYLHAQRHPGIVVVQDGVPQATDVIRVFAAAVVIPGVYLEIVGLPVTEEDPQPAVHVRLDRSVGMLG